jgi:hypothetical protein
MHGTQSAKKRSHMLNDAILRHAQDDNVKAAFVANKFRLKSFIAFLYSLHSIGAKGNLGYLSKNYFLSI